MLPGGGLDAKGRSHADFCVFGVRGEEGAADALWVADLSANRAWVLSVVVARDDSARQQHNRTLGLPSDKNLGVSARATTQGKGPSGNNCGSSGKVPGYAAGASVAVDMSVAAELQCCGAVPVRYSHGIDPSAQSWFVVCSGTFRLLSSPLSRRVACGASFSFALLSTPQISMYIRMKSQQEASFARFFRFGHISNLRVTDTATTRGRCGGARPQRPPAALHANGRTSCNDRAVYLWRASGGGG